jgi:hypothetical protein
MLERACAEAIEVNQQFAQWFLPEGSQAMLDNIE